VSHLKYAYLQQVCVENWEAAKNVVEEGNFDQVITRFSERCIKAFLLYLLIL
jgi:hypothetical protein